VTASQRLLLHALHSKIRENEFPAKIFGGKLSARDSFLQSIKNEQARAHRSSRNRASRPFSSLSVTRGNMKISSRNYNEVPCKVVGVEKFLLFGCFLQFYSGDEARKYATK